MVFVSAINLLRMLQNTALVSNTQQGLFYTDYYLAAGQLSTLVSLKWARALL